LETNFNNLLFGFCLHYLEFGFWILEFIRLDSCLRRNDNGDYVD
jgi:hypothetical protein